ncbi:MAG TPA: LacI family DNA-binding transcriptional regulator [Kiritimatiellia bacterium]|nr:LacI family DNA-binding transcriptional regulator [Kiritimatiellia bacterium]
MRTHAKRATIFDICKAAGVSSATVSRVINDSPLVHETTRRRVRSVIQKLGYRPSHAARMLIGRRSDTLGVIFPEMESFFHAEVLAGIDQAAEEAGFHVLTAFVHRGRTAPDLIRRFVEERRVDAAIFLNIQVNTPGSLRDVLRGGLPIVLLDRFVDKLPCVAIDNPLGARLAVEHLLRIGHRRIAFLRGPSENYDAAQRLAGVRAALKRAGTSLDPALLWSGDFNEESGAAAIRRWAAARQPWPDAILACNDTMAIGMLMALRELGVGVPGRVAVMGFDDGLGANWLDLTTIRVPRRELGIQAARMALSLARGERSEPFQLRVPVELVVRKTCGAPTRG